jgi:hypothetical protein
LRSAGDSGAMTMAKLIESAKNLGYTFLFGIVGSLVFGIATMLAVASLLQTPLYTTLVIAFFIPFNFSDMRTMHRERRWIALAGRLIMLIVISSFIFGLIRFASGYGQFEAYFGWILALIVPVLFVGITAYAFCFFFFPTNRAFVWLQARYDDLILGGKTISF